MPAPGAAVPLGAISVLPLRGRGAVRAGTGAVNRCAYRSVNRACPHTKAVEAVTGRNIPIQPTAADATGTGTPSLCRRPQTCQEFGHGQNLGSPHTKTVEAVYGRNTPIQTIARVPTGAGTDWAFKKFSKKISISAKTFAFAPAASCAGNTLGGPKLTPAPGAGTARALKIFFKNFPSRQKILLSRQLPLSFYYVLATHLGGLNSHRRPVRAQLGP